MGMVFPTVSTATVNTPGIVPNVPGYAINYVELNYISGKSASQIFIADPEILVLSNGTYLATHSYAGGSVDPDDAETKVFRSTNQGASWTYITTLSHIIRASLFEAGGVVYMVGSSHDELHSDTMMSRSTNNGLSWTTPVNFGSIDGDDTGPGTPCNPVVFDGRWWTCDGAWCLMSADVSANLYTAGSWTRATGFGPAAYSDFTYSATEPQLVASPNLGVFMMNQVEVEKNTTLSRVANNAGTYGLQFDKSTCFPSLPCGEKKFGAAYDSVSGKFYILGNPNLPADEVSSGMDVQMIRNTAAMLSSKDLLHWDVEKIFVHSSDVSREGYAYPNFDFDGDDLVTVVRTASADLPAGETLPNPGRAHDSNFLTYHRIDDFRTAVADHVVQVFGGNVRIYERTPETNDQEVIFGNFALGAFPGLTADAQSLGMDNGGHDIYLKRSAASGGQIFHFDAFGNFLENVGTTAPVPVTYSAVLSRRIDGECSWSKNGSGYWTDQTNWFYWGRPDTADETAIFGTAISSSSTVTVPSAMQTWGFNTTGDFEGWAVGRATATVSGGVLSGTATSTSSPYLIRSDCFFYGADATRIAIRMQAAQNCDVYLLWADTLNPGSYSYVSAPYTGNGAYQDVHFVMDGVSGWEDKAIASLRIDPRVQTNATKTFSIDWVSIPKAAVRIKGLRFNHHDPSVSYTIAGSGEIAMDADSGNASVKVVQGIHTITAPMLLKAETDLTTASGTILNLTGNLNFFGNTLNVSSAGQFKLGGIVYLSGGTLVTDGQTPIYINSGIAGALNGTLEFDPGAGFSPASGQNYDLFDNTSALNGMTFTSLSLPTLPTGLYWNTNSLYTSGVISIAAEQRSLTVSSAHGTTTPSVGAHNYDYGSSVSVQVNDPIIVYSDAYKYVCTGWTGTGNAPSSGSGSNTGSFTLTQNSTVTWLWTTYYYLGVSATTGGSVNQSSGWRTAGSGVTLTATPSTGYHFAGWSGDTSGDTNSTSMTVTMTETLYVTANFAPDSRTLTVYSAHGSPSPSVGVHTYNYGTSLSASVSSTVVNGTTRYVCDGWDGTGSVPASGGTANTGSFTLTQNSTVTWFWYTQYWLDTEAAVGGSVNVADSWQNSGANVTITATPAAGCLFAGWSGNTYGDTNNPVMTLPMTMARTVTAHFLPYIDFVETFESYTVGANINGQNGWSVADGNAVVTNLTYTWDDVYHPVEAAAHTKVLLCDDDADLSVNFITNAVAMNTTVDLMVNPLPGPLPDEESLSGQQGAFCVDYFGHLNVWCGLDATGTNNAWVAYTNTSIGTSEWIRITYEFDYTTDSGGGNFFRIRLNGEELCSGSGYIRGVSSFTANASGTWLRTANPNVEQLFSFSFKGPGMLDDVVVTDDTITGFFTDRSLTVSSAYGSPSPSVGAHSYTYGTSLSASVSTPVVNGTTRYVCTGWTGTGNVPSSGGSANTGSFTITADSSVSWQWATQYWLDTAATSGGSVNVGDSWQDSGDNVVITATPNTGYHFTGWTGNTYGDTNNTVMTLPMTMARAVTANFAVDQHTLTVSSAYSSPSPSVGVHTYDYGTSMSASVSTPVVNGTTRYVCTGWTGTGSVPSSGGSANTGSFTITADSSVSWQWATQYWLDTAATAGGSVNVGDSWQNSGANVAVTATATTGYHFLYWSGDTYGDVNNAVMTLPMTAPRAVTANFRPHVDFVETFESYTSGTSVVGSNGWTATSNSTAIATNLTYTWNDVYHPVESAAHTKVLVCDQTDLSVSFATNVAAVNTTVDMMVKPVLGTLPENGILSGKQSAFCVDDSGHLNVWCGLDATGTNNAWVAYTNTSIGTSEWVRITCEFDYTTDSGGGNFFRVRLNGVELCPGSGYIRGTSSFTANASGTWLRTANPNVEQVLSFSMAGSGMLDDLVVTDDIITDFIPPQGDALKLPEPKDSDGDGVLDWQEIIAGTDPNDAASTFKITGITPVVESGNEGFVIRWSSVDSGIYDLYWSTNLSEGFLPLATNLFATPPENAYTNPYVGPVFFYKVEGRVE